MLQNINSFLEDQVEGEVPVSTKQEIKSETGKRGLGRRDAREKALKASYVREIRLCELEEALNDPLVTDGGVVAGYTVRLLTHVERFRDQLDDIIRQKVEKWEFHRIAVLDKLILRLAVAELLYFPDVPPKVAINEAIEIAKTYSTEKSGRFVNGILDSIFNDLVRERRNAAHRTLRPAP